MARLYCLAFVGALAAPLAAQGPKPRPVLLAAITRDVVVPAFAADTLVTTVRWTNPVDDGKGALDSLKVNVTSLSGGWVSQKFTGTWPTFVVVRQVLPSRDATYDVTAQLCTFRGNSANATTCVSVAAAPFVYALLPPPPVTGVTVTNAKVP